MTHPAKEKLAIPLELALNLRTANGKSFLRSFEDAERKVDPLPLLSAPDIRPLTDAEKPDYVVIKFAYLLLDSSGTKVGLISRAAGRHSNNVEPYSALLSSGMEPFYSSHKLGGESFLSSYYPFTRKLGALANEFEIPARRYEGIPGAARFFAFAMRREPLSSTTI
ncbi:MAG TPA: hypothetical protein VEB22_00225 [Phycisphaerales bacterium]|nr:hypothetical protein [Phycisphaerales bacterium]